MIMNIQNKKVNIQERYLDVRNFQRIQFHSNVLKIIEDDFRLMKRLSKFGSEPTCQNTHAYNH